VTQVTDASGRAAQDAVIATHQELFMFKTNVGGIDRIARIAGGLVLLGLAATGTIGVWGYIGIVPLATGLMSSCPLYSIIGLNTCPTKQS
jgi:hypothetical protein